MKRTTNKDSWIGDVHCCSHVDQDGLYLIGKMGLGPSLFQASDVVMIALRFHGQI